MNGELAIFISTLAAAISALFAALSTIMTYRLYRKEKLQRLNEQLNKIIEISIQYPYVENDNFISKWLENREGQDEKYLRYDLYCNLLFNFLASLFDYYDGKKKEIEGFVDVKTWVRIHKLNWKNPVDPNENIDGYSPKFREFINSYI